MTVEMFKTLEQEGIEWLHTILNDFMKQERLPQDLKDGEIRALYKKEDVMHCENYRGIKLLEIGLKVYDKVIEMRIRERVELHDNQFGFRPGRGTMEAEVITRQVQEKILEGNNKIYWTFVDLEKAFDRVPREVIYLSLREKGITEKMVPLVKSMYEAARTSVK